jgi:hypothetical protein
MGCCVVQIGSKEKYTALQGYFLMKLILSNLQYGHLACTSRLLSRDEIQ